MTLARSCPVAATALLIGLAGMPSAHAQSAPEVEEQPRASDAFLLGEWAVRPTLQLRSQGEYRKNPFDAGGQEAPATQATASTEPSWPPVEDQWFVFSRARLGLDADRGPVRAVVQLQDARAWGETSPLQIDARASLPTTHAFQAFAEVHEADPQPSYLRLGRQQIVWGDGRLLGGSDWSPTARAFDAIRGKLVLGDFDFEAFASLLTAPGALPPDLRHGEEEIPEGTGGQLYGARIAWYLSPLLNVEAEGLARVLREPTFSSVTPSDLIASGLRVSGAYPPIRYSVEGVYEIGQSAAVRDTQDLRAFAAAARVAWDTGLFWKLALGAQGAYASGQDPSSDRDEATRFDPLFPDVRTAHGAMGLFAWSNLMEGAGWIDMSPWKDSTFTFAYRYVALAEPGDSWQTGALVPVGNDTTNSDRMLGHELDATIALSPWSPVGVVAGYGAFLTGEGAKNILEAAGRGRPDLQHYGYLQATVNVP